MKRLSGRAWWGILLIVLGALFLLQELQIVGNAFQYLWMVVMFAAGAGFLWVFVTNDKQWWAVIPGLGLLALAFASLESALNLLPAADWGGPVFLGGLGAAFWLVYARQQEHWWALIPGGVLVTLGVVAGLDEAGSDFDGGIFFLGLGLTFVLVALLPSREHDTRWSWIPGAVLLLLGLTQITAVGSEMLAYWPVLLILIGGYILIKGWRG